MPANEVLKFYGLVGPFGKIRYALRFILRFMLDKIAFFCFIPIKNGLVKMGASLLKRPGIALGSSNA